jgi:hypothetical protein
VGLGHGNSLSWWNLTGGTDSLRTYIATNKVVQSGLVLNLDAGASTSYPGSGTTWTNLVGGGNNGTLTNGPTYSSANGGSIVFDGTNDYVSYGISLANGFSAITVNAWVKPTTFPNTTFIFEHLISSDDGSSGGLESCFSLQIAHQNNPTGGLPASFIGNSIYFGIRTSTQSSRNIPIAIIDGTLSANIPYITGCAISVNPPEYYLNGWMFLTGVYTGNETLLYINGIQKATSNLQPDGTNRSLSGVLNTSSILRTIGADVSGSGTFTGSIPQVSIYNRALSAAEVSQNFNALRGRFGI